MSRKNISIIISAAIALLLLFWLLISQLVLAPAPTTDSIVPPNCSALGLQSDPADSTKCLAIMATTTPTTTPLSPAPTSTTTVTKFSTPITLRLAQTQMFTDGLTITLHIVSDSRCKPEVQCIWAGELAPEFTVTGGEFKQAVFRLTLGTVRNSKIIQGPYIFTLVDASEKTMVITVTKISAEVTTGRVQGTVAIGPICPVERMDEPCQIPPTVYTSRQVIVYGPAEDTKISQTPLESDGSFNLSLASGTYWLQIAPAGISPGEKKKIVVTSDKTLTIDFDIDTGIR